MLLWYYFLRSKAHELKTAKQNVSDAMSDHTSAVFNNSCLKIPRNPVSKQPFPVYDQKFIHQLENKARKLSLESDCLNINNKSKGRSEKTLKSFIEFYDSIPDYDELNHLSNKEFYRRLDILKEKQRDYYEYLDRNGDWIDEYKNLSNNEYKRKNSNKSTHIFCNKPIINVNKEDNESISSCEKDIKPPSRRSVRIESPSEKFTPEETPDLPYFRSKSRANVSSAGSKGHNTTNDSFWDVCSVDECPFDQHLTTRSAPNSPCKSKGGLNWKDDGITVPKPFEMTVRDEENKIVDDIMVKTKKNKPEEKHEMFRANPIPIESQIPLFDKIMADQEKRRQKIKNKSKAVLKAQMRPFSFTKRDEEIQAITRRLSKSSPCIFLESTPIKYKPFKAKPIPKHIFSDYIYQKMNEDEFYRALQKKIRSEEMLKASSLPPSMAKRETKRPKYVVCPRSFRDFDIDQGVVEKIMREKINNNDENIITLEKELEELENLENDFLKKSPKNYKSKRKTKNKYNRPCSSAETKSTNRSFSAMDAVSRSNLAAVLRIQTTRRKMELEMCKKMEEVKLRDEARWKEKVMRKKPVWQELQYSHEEDLAMRLQLRRDEERLRDEEHKHRMQMMIGRVKRQPTLFERQSKVKNLKTREELLARLYKDLNNYSSNSSDVSDKKCVETKDEAIQAHFEDVFNKKGEGAILRKGGSSRKLDECLCQCEN